MECRKTRDCAPVIGDATPAFQKTVPYLLKNQRQVLFVRNIFFVIIDEIELKKKEHADWMLHCLYSFEIGGNCVSMTGQKAGMKVIFANTEMNLTQSDVFEGVNPEWYLRGETLQKKNRHKIAAVLYPYTLGKEELLSVERDGDEIEVRLG